MEFTDKKLKILELFGGIGACSKALERIGIDFEIVDYVEIDKYAVASFNAIHNTNFEPQDITQWDKDIDIDLVMHGSPCQDFSVAGKQAGGDKGSGTRSSLMYETVRIVEKLKPKYVIWENVKNLLSKKHKHNFDAYIETMNILGYNSYYRVLNAKYYGIPQNRERVYTISIRKDIDNNNFTFPEKEELKLRLKDMLEDKVDEKYYLSDEKITKIQNSNFMQEKKRIQDKDYSDTIMSNSHIGGYTAHKILVKNATKKGYDEAIEGDSINLSYPESTTRRGRVGHQVAQTLQCNDLLGVVESINKNAKHQQDLVQSEDDICRTIPAGTHGSTPHLLKTIVTCNDKRLKNLVEKTEFIEGQVMNLDTYNQTTNKEVSQCITEPHHNNHRLFDGLRIRKLTPKECWRLMGFDDSDFEKAQKVNSNTQLYKQARKLDLRTRFRKNI